MRKISIKKGLCALLAMCCLMSAAHAERSLSDLRERYAAIPKVQPDYETMPDIAAGISGRLSDDCADSMLQYVRFMRWLAGIDEAISLSDDYTSLAQSGAALLAASDKAAHSLPQPKDFPDALYADASKGIGGSNIAAINWVDNNVLFTAIDFFQRDEGEQNRFALGHRRWLLSPALQHTGFGFAVSETGMTYATMYVHDFTAQSIYSWEHVAWPSDGAFPAEYMYEQTPWCVILNPQVYPQLTADPITIDIRCAETGEHFVIDRMAQEDAADAYWIDDNAYGLGSALIFRPFTAAEYEQNQHWRVSIGGLTRADGQPEGFTYEVQMVSLQPIPVRLIEAEPESLSLHVGESAAVTANVVPAWADDIHVEWSSSDPSVASVDHLGRIHANAVGSCTITAGGANDQQAECSVTVTE